MPRTVINQEPDFALQRARRENLRRANTARRTLGLAEADLDESERCVQDALLDLLVGCSHLVQGRTAKLNMAKLVEEVNRLFKIEYERASRSVTWFNEESNTSDEADEQTKIAAEAAENSSE